MFIYEPAVPVSFNLLPIRYYIEKKRIFYSIKICVSLGGMAWCVEYAE